MKDFTIDIHYKNFYINYGRGFYDIEDKIFYDNELELTQVVCANVDDLALMVYNQIDIKETGRAHV